MRSHWDFRITFWKDLLTSSDVQRRSLQRSKKLFCQLSESHPVKLESWSCKIKTFCSRKSFENYFLSTGKRLRSILFFKNLDVKMDFFSKYIHTTKVGKPWPSFSHQEEVVGSNLFVYVCIHRQFVCFFYVPGKLTRWVCEKIAQSVAQYIFVKINA
jgi:hypothetical protein